ncbi:MAG: DUF1292 domain-containing protein [Ruminococcaceae bacterium]|nr:DUF1292 domain-containing protein [Oscillospiraceae bacterium]
MWIIILCVIVAGAILFKVFDRDFISARQLKGKTYHLSFENGKEADCELIAEYDYNEKDYFVFVPLASMKCIPDEDIIILRQVRKTAEKSVFVFADKETDEKIYRQVKKQLGGKYNFS